MKKVRQDAWSQADDSLLAEVILRHVRSGSTQLAAFQEASKSLGRTAAATGYRWNANVRKEYVAQIEIAKAQWKEVKGRAEAEGTAVPEPAGWESAAEGAVAALDWPAVLKFLKGQKGTVGQLQTRLTKLERELAVQTAENVRLSEENRKLRAELNRVGQELTLVKEDHSALVGIMERARKLAFVGEPLIEASPAAFVMEENGNLERMK
ncbi:RsfA family transcriptional regulator [Tumebacillus sp. BK434]|uniref:RsfA family transcriptional regulator n=1 Tax=Tumebacillus sp. BK434 TaxID=2512169 RepID=UPI0010461FDA|nr:RsfA family transcriptional regulator [Tumebacillus sp. BK434]